MRRVLLAAVLLGVAAAPAAGKEGVRARIEGPVRCDAAAGSTITVSWRLVSRDGRPFGAGGIYVRLLSDSGARPSKAYARERGRGRFRARVRVPAGGIRRLDVGLDGWRIIGKRRDYAPVSFPIQNDPCR